MSNLLDISIHGPQRVAIVEQLVHICRYTPGLVLLEEDAGSSPVNFLRHMADLLRDELDFALLDSGHCDLMSITHELVAQWFIYQAEEHEQTAVQSVHHYLDLGLQSGRLALIVVERSSLLAENAMNFLVDMMARHSRLTILFAGIIDARSLLRRAQQAEIPVHRIDLHDSATPSASHVAKPDISKSSAHLSVSGFDHTFSDDSYELPEDDDVFEDDLREPDAYAARSGGRREPVVGEQYATQSSVRFNTSDSMLGVSTRLSAVQEWGSATLASIRKNKQGGGLLLLGCLALVVLLLLFVRNSRDTGIPNNAGETVVGPALVVEAPPPARSSALPPAIGSAGKSGDAGTVEMHTQVGAPPAPAVPAPVEVPPISGPPLPQPVSQQHETARPEQVASMPEQAPIPKRTTGELSLATKVQSGARQARVTEKYWKAKPGNFTVQVAAAHGEANIRRLEAKLPAGQPHYVYSTIKNGKPWFILIYGSFSSKAAASSARDSLAVDISKDSKPWVRKQGEVFAQ
jgi:cell division septation protein DedD